MIKFVKFLLLIRNMLEEYFVLDNIKKLLKTCSLRSIITAIKKLYK